MKLKFPPDVTLDELATILEAMHEEDPLAKRTRDALPDSCKRCFVEEEDVSPPEPEKNTKKKRTTRRTK